MSQNWDRFFVVTGGPGSGKSSLIERLERHGYKCAPEAGRGVIHDQVATRGHALPWSDRQLFSELMLCWDMRSFHIAEQEQGTFFFDRGIPDVLAYLRLCGLAVREHMRIAADKFRYNRVVFIAPPWPEIFHQDRERKQDFEEAVRTYHALNDTYVEHGYHLIEIPRASVEQRFEFVLSALTRVGHR